MYYMHHVDGLLFCPETKRGQHLKGYSAAIRKLSQTITGTC